MLAVLTAGGHEGRFVGGIVRNALMGKPVGDVDIATTAEPDQVVRLARAVGLRVIETGLQHGTVTVVSEGLAHEVTTLRRDVETDGRHATVAFTHDWAEDAARRDFTMNALYCDASGRIFDPLGGLPDLLAARVRFIGSADARIAEDYLRILRFFRFHAEHGAGAPDAAGLAACVRGRAGLTRLSAERVRSELFKLSVAPGALPAFDAMFDHGLLTAVLGAAPRLGILTRLLAIEALLECTPDPVLRVAALSLHGADDVPRLIARLRLSNGAGRILEGVTSPLARLLRADLGEAAAKPLLFSMGADLWRPACLLRWAWSGDAVADPGWRSLLDLPDRWPVPTLPIAGRDLLALGLAPGPRVGSLLRQLEAEWIAGGFTMPAAGLLERARALIAD